MRLANRDLNHGFQARYPSPTTLAPVERIGSDTKSSYWSNFRRRRRVRTTSCLTYFKSRGAPAPRTQLLTISLSDSTLCSMYRLRVVLNGVSPLVWRRLLVSSETNLADLHEILQLAFGWSGFYLYEFRIHGRTFGEERSVCLADLQLHPGERFLYCYNFFVFWEWDVRLEAILPR